jgi:excisionase family DNA binding protein
MDSQSVLLTVTEAAARLKIGRTALYALLQSRELAFVKIGARTLIPEYEIARFITERTIGRGATPPPTN